MTPDFTPLSAHLTTATSLMPAIKLWEMYLRQRSFPHTIKAFSADMQLLGNYLAPDRPIGAITTID